MSANLPSHGPLYVETDLSRLPVEPWNTVTTLPFLAIALYWMVLAVRRSDAPWLLRPGSILLLIGFIGGAVFHGTRAHRIWLILDFMPIFLLTMLASWTLWIALLSQADKPIKGLRAGMLAAALTALPILLQRMLWIYSPFPRGVAIGAGYALLAAGVILPAALLSRRQTRDNNLRVAAALAGFITALLFRQMDWQFAAYLPMGSHFLWHLFGAWSVYLLGEYFLHLAPSSARREIAEAARA